MSDIPDSIERQIDIQADVQRVYSLVARPGWWINEGEVTDNVTATDGDVSTVTHPKYGSFRIQTVEARPPSYVSFRWLDGDQEVTPDAPGTLVEFWLEESGSGVTVKVVESGFSTLPISAEERRKKFEGNSKGWEFELDVARRHIEGS